MTQDHVEARLSAVEDDVAHLQDLVDGQQPYSHRRRLHKLENRAAGDELVAQALGELRKAQHLRTEQRWSNVREWGGFALAAAAILISTHPWS